MVVWNLCSVKGRIAISAWWDTFSIENKIPSWICLILFDFQNFLHYSTTQYILHPLFSFRLFVSPYFWQVYIFYTCHYILLKLYPSFWFVYLLSLNLGLLQPDINTNANLGAAGAEALFICFPHWPPLLCFITQSSTLTTACPSVSFQCLCLGPSILFCLLSL